ncbi:MAG: ATP-binding protein [Synechococcales cyanobacterium RU_4_20]|nr:ATP-binding protein [Synechococcales cyanobacterium RU_4_20]
MQPFDKSTAKFFFGKERTIARLEKKLDVSRLIFFFGPSGSGKSSIIKAGLIPKLQSREDKWDILEVDQPGTKPILRVHSVWEDFFRKQEKLTEFKDILLQPSFEFIENCMTLTGGKKDPFSDRSIRRNFYALWRGRAKKIHRNDC